MIGIGRISSVEKINVIETRPSGVVDPTNKNDSLSKGVITVPWKPVALVTVLRSVSMPQLIGEASKHLITVIQPTLRVVGAVSQN